MSRRCDKVALPSYYIGPTRRPRGRIGLAFTPDQIAWDQMDTWPTTAEWLAWVRRHDGRKSYWDGRRWCWPMRPVIMTRLIVWSTTKIRRLP